MGPAAVERLAREVDLEQGGYLASSLTPAQIEAGFLAGLAAIVAARGH